MNISVVYFYYIAIFFDLRLDICVTWIDVGVLKRGGQTYVVQLSGMGVALTCNEPQTLHHEPCIKNGLNINVSIPGLPVNYIFELVLVKLLEKKKIWREPCSHLVNIGTFVFNVTKGM